MNLRDACTVIGTYLEHDPALLFEYATEDKIGGWNTDPAAAPLWGCGSVWEHEGQLLYAIVRAERPKCPVEIGNLKGCSTAHIAEALVINDNGMLESIDLYPLAVVSERHRQRVRLFVLNLFNYNYDRNPPIDFIFLDDYHSHVTTAHVFRNFADFAAPGSVIVVHDSEQAEAGPEVKKGIEKVVARGDYLSIAIDPSDCGLAIWRKP